MTKLIEKLIGKKYYMILCFDGVQDFISSTPFPTKKEAKEHLNRLSDCRSLRSGKILSFRTKETLVILSDKLH